MGPKTLRRNPKRGRNIEKDGNDNSDQPSTYAKKLRRKMLERKTETDNCSSFEDTNMKDLLNGFQNDREDSVEQLCKVNQNERTAFWEASRTADFDINFSSRNKQPDIGPNLMFPYLQRSLNFFHHQYRASVGLVSHPLVNHSQSVSGPIASIVSNMHLYRTGSPFDRRVTAMEWHPTNPDLVAVGSKGGDIILWNTETVNNNDNFIHGRGPGGNVSGMKFHPVHPHRLYTSTLDGRLTLQDFTGKHKEIFLDTMTWDFWYCSVDVNSSRKVVVTGDNVGNTLLLSDDGKKLWSHRLHKGKVTHTEFSPREDWLLCTASIDHTVKMWDIRMISSKKSALCIISQNKGINSAYFNPSDGTRLLTTDQGSELCVYRAPDWSLETNISHPHRFFQHITPIKASWHPLQDLIVVGRYPDKTFPGFTENEKRTIDIFDAASGKMVCQLHDSAAPGIVSLNVFNHMGDKLASGMGVNILIWSRQDNIMEKQKDLLKKFKQHSFQRSEDGTDRPVRRKPASKQTKTKTDTKLKTKVKAKTKQL